MGGVTTNHVILKGRADFTDTLDADSKAESPDEVVDLNYSGMSTCFNSNRCSVIGNYVG